MAWLTRESAPLPKTQRKESPDGLWEKCKNCSEIILWTDIKNNLYVCPKCDFHYYLPADERIKSLLDKNSFKEYNTELKSVDPLDFCDTKPYKDRLEATIKKVGRNDAIVTGRGSLSQIPVHMGVFDFKFMGGSMGSVVGEKITRLLQQAAKKNEPAIIVSASGGARMQEGIVSLMQMSKTCAAVAVLRDKGIPFLSILANPTTGGVAASFAMLGDVNIAEPRALIGFAGPRVIEQTLRQKLPQGFQKSEFLLEHGMVDMICHRKNLKERLTNILDILYRPKD